MEERGKRGRATSCTDIHATFRCHQVLYHFHGFNLSIRLIGIDMTTILHKVLHELSRGRGSQVCGVILLLKDTSLAADHYPVLVHLLFGIGVVAGAVEGEEEGAVCHPVHLHLQHTLIHLQCKHWRGCGHRRAKDSSSETLIILHVQIECVNIISRVQSKT